MGSHDIVIEQANWVVAPRIVHAQANPGDTADITVLGQPICLSVDSTSRGYDLSQLPWNGVKQGKVGDVNAFFISIQCETADVYYLFDSAAPGTNAIDETISIAAGTALSLKSASPYYPAHLPFGNSPLDIYLEHLVDKTLIVKCASGKTATLRIWPCSNSLPGAT